MSIPLKPGISTTEFWLVIIGSLLLTVQTAFNMLDPAWAAGGVTLLGLIYASIRGKLKGIQAQSAADQLKAQSDSTQHVNAGVPPPAT